MTDDRDKFVNALVADTVTTVGACFYIIQTAGYTEQPMNLLWTIILFGRLMTESHDRVYVSYRDVYFEDIDLLILRFERFSVELDSNFKIILKKYD